MKGSRGLQHNAGEAHVPTGRHLDALLERGESVAHDAHLMPSGSDRQGGHGRVPHEAAVKDRKSTRLNSSHLVISYAVFCLKKKTACHYSCTITALHPLHTKSQKLVHMLHEFIPPLMSSPRFVFSQSRTSPILTTPCQPISK